MELAEKRTAIGRMERAGNLVGNGLLTAENEAAFFSTV